eukprot:TRINITY_DN67653_c0_g1_i1.p1 TRINITY_DN67653_c0_g1~~TRINITY_DN67653_c0_g1_i1.p1  ORF type:complete len:299 (-),score=17.51 TRINITY_DN67653_c0_g1_i1:156-1031(-)
MQGRPLAVDTPLTRTVPVGLIPQNRRPFRQGDRAGIKRGPDQQLIQAAKRRGPDRPLAAVPAGVKSFAVGPGKAPPGTPRQSQAPMVTRAFQFHSHHDGNGVVFYLGQDRRTGEWTNPVLSRELRVCASSLGAGTLEMAVDHTYCNLLFQTEDQPWSWVIFDFGERSVRPNCYTLSHRSGIHAFFMRTWQLEGSVDNDNWNILSRHVDDDSIGPTSPVASWPVHPRQYYRYLRIVLDPNGNSEGGSALVFNSFEVYGDLQMPAPPHLHAPPVAPIQPKGVGPRLTPRAHTW